MSGQNSDDTKVVVKEDMINPPASPLIFISHDTRDAELAETFSKLLSSVSCGVLKSFRSSDRKGSQGIEYGVEWYPELMKKLNIASDVVCLLTQRSLDRPWILYEAGVAKGKLNTPVYGVALGIPLNRANSGPFAQFQNCDDNEESITKLIMQLVHRIPNSEPDHDAIALQVKLFKEKIGEILNIAEDKKGTDKKTDKVDEASVAKLFEEVKVMFQDLPIRIEGRLTENGDPIRRRKIRRFNPIVFEEISFKIKDPIGILIFISYFKEDFPWLYEIGLEVYRALKSGNRHEIDKSLMTFKQVNDFMLRGPFMEEVSMISKDIYMAIKEFPYFVEHYVSNYISHDKKIKSRNEIINE